MCRKETVRAHGAPLAAGPWGSWGGCGGPDGSLGQWAGVVAPGKSSKEMTSECLKGAERELTSPDRKEQVHAKAWLCEMAQCTQDGNQVAVRDGAGREAGSVSRGPASRAQEQSWDIGGTTRRP